MGKKEDLQKEIELLEKQEKEKSIKDQLDRMTLVGKCYASHKLNRYMTDKKSFTFDVIHLKDKNYKEQSYQEYAYVCDVIHVCKDGDRFEVTRLEGREDSPSLWRYEISYEEFLHVKEQFIAYIEAGVNKIRNKFIAQDWVSQGNHHNKFREHEHLDKAGTEFIDFADDKKFSGSNLTVFEILRFGNHPYIYNSRLYKLDNWKEIIISIADRMEKNAVSWGSSIYERDMPRVQALRIYFNLKK